MHNLNKKVKLSYPNFRKQWILNDLNGWSYAYHLKDEPCELWFQRLVGKIEESIKSKKYFPIYRMGDGEYNFVLGYTPSGNDFLNLIGIAKLKSKILQIIKGNNHISGNVQDGQESYTKDEINLIKKSYIDNLKFVSKNGVVTHAFDNGKNFGRYLRPVTRFFKKHGIEITEDNYFHGYHMYALFTSELGFNLLKDKSILIISSLDKYGCESLIINLKKIINIRSINFISVSKSKALLEILPKIEGNFDIVLVAAGVGSLNVINQIKYLSCPCIDVGTVVNCYASPERLYERPYMVSDEIFDIHKIKYIDDKLRNKYIRNYMLYI